MIQLVFWMVSENSC